MKKVIDSGRFSMGEAVKSFEKAFSKYLDSKFCVMVNSGSSANLLMIAALYYSKKFSLKRGDEVIVPAVSWSTTYYPLYQYGLNLRFVDIDLNTLNYDIDKLKKSITSNTKLIVAVNLLGNPNDFDILKTLVDENNLILIEDNCERLEPLTVVKKQVHLVLWAHSVPFSAIIFQLWKGVLYLRTMKNYTK